MVHGIQYVRSKRGEAKFRYIDKKLRVKEVQERGFIDGLAWCGMK
jgi:hypothetical protein